MPKKNKTRDEHLQTIEFLLAGLLMKKEVDVKKVARIIGCSDKTLTAIYPERKRTNKSDK